MLYEVLYEKRHYLSIFCCIYLVHSYAFFTLSALPIFALKYLKMMVHHEIGVVNNPLKFVGDHKKSRLDIIRSLLGDQQTNVDSFENVSCIWLFIFAHCRVSIL